MSKFEKFIYIACPWLFGTVLVVASLFCWQCGPDTKLIKVVMIGMGFILISLFGVCSILVKILETLQKK